MINLLALTVLTIGQVQYPLDEELKSGFSGNTCEIEMICKVTKTGNTYTYMYSVKNKGTKPIKFKWDIINQAMHFGNNVEFLIDLDPDENAIFTLEHPDPPMQTQGKATSFYLTNSDKVENRINQIPDVPKGMKIKISKKTFYSSDSGYGHGALPQSFLDNMSKGVKYGQQ